MNKSKNRNRKQSMNEDEIKLWRDRLALFNLSELARQSGVQWHRLKNFRNGTSDKIGADDIAKVQALVDSMVCKVEGVK
ncbi:hypothetical protein P8625_01 [Verrucomicrobia phage P8625]|uniref:hypothetical protein n=1 Tax=Verrucomicrobia phage P8625 TaxID=1636271 RepID=UPI0005FEB639|nr:hypothetical protein AWI59_gp01 [Verrucomicrobia phage P8625]AKA60252.1 hypothetical protein P8625_01 [Verrucomicrobia phage P8625]